MTTTVDPEERALARPDQRTLGAPARGPRPAPVVPRAWAEAGLAAGWASLLIVTGLWLADGGLTGVRSAADVWLSMGRLTGLLASDLLLVQVLLMARIPFLEKAFGQDALAMTHRWVGFGSFALMLVHVGMTLLGYAGASPGALWSSTVAVVLDMPAMLPAALGTLCLVAVVATSCAAARRRLRYESWHLLHLYAYLGCFLALPHQLWTGADFLGSPLATAYWWALWAGAAGAVLTYRVGLPALRNARHRLVVADVRPAGGGAATVSVVGRRLEQLPAAGGQFFTWRFLDGPGWTRAHPYSLSAAPDGRSLQITVAPLGAGSRRVASLSPGTRVLIEGPYGRLHEGVRTRRGVLLLAAGIGVAPMKALLESLHAAPGDVTLIYRVSDAADAPLLAEVAASAEEVGARLVVLAGHRAPDRASWLPADWARLGDVDALRHLCPDVADRDVYLCGCPGWTDVAGAAVLAAGVPRHRLHTERFAV